MTEIEWTHVPGYTGKSWNPVTGCQKIASGCRNCYAAAVANRFWGERKFTDVQTHADRLDQPLRRRKPTCWFVNSMSDLFHEAVPFEFIAAVYGVMAACPRHLFIILTKRPERMLEFHEWAARQYAPWDRGANVVCRQSASAAIGGEWAARAQDSAPTPGTDWPWPLPNVWHGVSVAEQKDADKNIPILLQVPSAIRFVSAEPLIGPVELDGLWGYAGSDAAVGLDWIITGGESGPGARPCDVAWIRSIIEQCKAAGVACFTKQLGKLPAEDGRIVAHRFKSPKCSDPSEWPADLRVREWPEVQA